MAASGRIRRRLALAIVLTALIPLLAAVWLAESMVRATSAKFFIPDVGAHLDKSLGLYQELARSMKGLMRQEAAEIAHRPGLRRAAAAGDRSALEAELKRAFADHPSLVSLSVRDAGGAMLAELKRDKPLDRARENQLEVGKALSDSADGPEADDAAQLLAVFAADKSHFDDLAEMSQFVDTYKQVERRRGADERSYLLAFTALLCITIVAAIGVGSLLARGVSRRIAELARATRLVGEGDLNIRVPEGGGDEIADLAGAFNRMLGEVESSRARIEYLQRISAWQEMARRLAHEIKNPLTPISLAVQEIHRRYSGSDAEYRRLVDTTLEIVEDEVGTLRRLVGEFSDFARLPQASLFRADLAEFVREQAQRFGIRGADRDSSESALDELLSLGQVSDIKVEFVVPEGPCEALIDAQMLRRVLFNLVRNAAQALVGRTAGAGRVLVRLARDGEFWNLDVEDNGPGIPLELRETVFDPYVTTKDDGTGLGLSIVKKVVIEHGGTIRAGQSDLGGARLRVRLPVLGTRAAARAMEDVPTSLAGRVGLELRPGTHE
ncbi:MAG TPA: ATP-binding protein [Polyangiaceae bacterium]|nr:ATP-binding protein [Polyangiaceae bacterium]